MKLIKNIPAETKAAIDMMDLLMDEGQTKLAWKLWRNELNRLRLDLRRQFLLRAMKKNIKANDSLRVDIDHFMLIHLNKD